MWLCTSEVACTAFKNLGTLKLDLSSLLFYVPKLFLFPLESMLGSVHCTWSGPTSLPNFFILFFPFAQWHATALIIHYSLPAWGLLSFSLHLECSVFPIFTWIPLCILWFQLKCHLHEEFFPYLSCLHSPSILWLIYKDTSMSQS